MKEIYLDNAATTRVRKEVLKEMERYFIEDFGNPSSVHQKGEVVLRAMNDARAKLAKEISAKPEEIIFTSSATESNNIALRYLKINNKRNKFLISEIEHPSISETAGQLGKKSYKVGRIKVDSEGRINFDDLEKKIDSKTFLVSVIHANNVFGTIQDLKKIGELCRRKGVRFHTDAVQSFGKEKIDVEKMKIDMLSASAHKIGGPKGIGLLYVRNGVKIMPWLFGGGQERGLRSGTENVASIVGFAKALELQKKINVEKIKKLRDKLIFELEKIGGKINGSKKERLWNNVHVSFDGIDGEMLAVFLSQKEIYVSVGSACESKKKKDDMVLEALGLSKGEIRGSVRISLSVETREKDIKKTVYEIGRFMKNVSRK